MNKYLKEILKFLLGFIIILLVIAFVFSLYINKIKRKNDEFAKNNVISYKKNENRIEYQYSQDMLNTVQIEKVKNPENKNIEYNIYYPINTDEKIPLIIWSGDEDSTDDDYKKSLESLSSYGFLVLYNQEKNTGDGKSTYQAIEAIDTLNKEKDSALYEKVDMENIGLGGHGQGACEALNASYLKKNNNIKSIFLTSLPKLGTIKNHFNFKDKSSMIYDLSKVSHPIFITAGSGKIDSFYCPLEAISEEINKIDKKVEAYGAIRKKYDNNLVNNYHPLGYMNAWFAYTLQKDTTAANAFIVNEELKNNPKWAYVKDNR